MRHPAKGSDGNTTGGVNGWPGDGGLAESLFYRRISPINFGLLEGLDQAISN